MKQTKEYSLMDFDIYDRVLIKKLAEYLFKKFEGVKIKVFYENTGFYNNISLDELSRKLDGSSKRYTGLDEISLEKDSSQILGIVFHADLCILKLDTDMRKNAEEDLGIKLVPYKKKKS
jgi:hypothetical protein